MTDIQYIFNSNDIQKITNQTFQKSSVEMITAAKILYEHINNSSDKKIDAGPSYGNFLIKNTYYKKVVGKGKLKEFISEFKDIFYFVHDEKVGGKGWICIRDINPVIFHSNKSFEDYYIKCNNKPDDLKNLINKSLIINNILKNISYSTH